MNKEDRTTSKRGRRRTGKASRLKFTISISPAPMTQAEWEIAENLLAKMVARAIWARHLEFHESCSLREMEKKKGAEEDEVP